VQQGPSSVLDYGSAPFATLDLEEIQETHFVNVKALLNWSVLCMEKFSATAATLTLLRVNDTSTSVRPLLAAEVNSK
jgi:hypothetical protein